MNQTVRILLLEDNRGDVTLFKVSLSEEVRMSYSIEDCDAVSEGLYKLYTREFDIIMLDLNLRDSRGPDTFEKIHKMNQEIPIVILTGLDDEQMGLDLVKKGAQDYIIKGRYDGPHLARIIRYAMERKKLMRSLQKLSTAIEQSPVSVVITDINGKIEYVNESFIQKSGFEPGEIIGKNPRFDRTGYFAQATNRDLWEIIYSGQQWQGEVRQKNKNGGDLWESVSVTPIYALNEKISNFLVIKEDITVRKNYETQLFRQANYDELTGLPNRNLATDRLRQITDNYDRDRRKVAVLFIGLHDFHIINENFGHAVGDKVLIETGRRLQGRFEHKDTVARFSGDEFLIILPESKEDGNIERVIQEILTDFQKPYVVEGKEIVVPARIGITIFPSDGTDVETLLQNAHIAMTQNSRRTGQTTFNFFKSEMTEQVFKRMSMTHELRRAIQNKELSLHYQPQVNVADQKICGMEALLRWQNPQLGFVPPDQFIPLAEDSNLIIDIGNWVLKEACRQLKSWQEKTGGNYRMAVNVSYRQFKESKSFVKFVSEIISELKLPPNTLELEITERLLIDESGTMNDLICQFRAMGVRFAIDDFGTGYCSLSYIKNFPLNVVKIDRSFIKNIPANESHARLAKAVIALGHSLDLEIVAEGVETKEQLDFLRENKCDFFQGFWFSKPLPPEGFTEKFLTH